MMKPTKKQADISDFKFNLTMDQVRDNTLNAIEKIQGIHCDFAESAKDIVNVSLYIKHYSLMKEIPASNFGLLFDLHKQKDELERRFKIRHGEGKLIEVQHDAGQKYVDYLKKTQQP